MKNISIFCDNHKMTTSQFYGTETVGGSLDLRSLTSIPDGFNPTVGGSLYLEGLTSSFQQLNGQILSWLDFKYVCVDGKFSEVLSKKKNFFKLRDVNSEKTYFCVSNTESTIHAHGNTLKEAHTDLIFKVASEKIKQSPITTDTIINGNYYHIVTGACNLGINDFKNKNGLADEYTAQELLKILEKTKPYGFEKFKKMLTF